jgi:hypothetical protein
MAESTGGVNGDKPPAPDPGFLGVLDQVGVSLEDFIKGMMEAKMGGIDAELQPGQVHSFRHLMMPALVRVGAVTDRTRELFKKEGIPVWEDLATLEAMEDSDTGDLDFDRIPT